MKTQNNVEKKSRLRSPNYPALNLQKSLELARKLFDVHSRRPIPLEVAAQDWGVAPASSYTAQHVAAVAAYGLVEIEGSKDARKLKISDLAYNIFIDNRPDSRDRSVLIAEAALKPDIFQKLYVEYPEKLPADHALQYELVKNHKFNPNAVPDFISIIKATFDFAKVYESGILEAESFPAKDETMIAASDKIPVKEGLFSEISNRAMAFADEREIANYPIGQGLKARIMVSGKSPLTMKAIDKLIKLLDLNKEDLPEGDEEEKLFS